MTNANVDPDWEAMFDIQHAMSEKIEQVFEEHTRLLPPLWRATARSYLIEQWAEKLRYDVELPPRTSADKATEDQS